MSIELLFTTLALIGLAALRLGLPLIGIWLFSKALRYAQAVLP